MTIVRVDGHSHTHFCKHGHDAALDDYLQAAMQQQFVQYAVTEHPPLPARWVKDEALFAELGMTMEELPAYFAYVAEKKAQYAEYIDVRIGLEFDYLFEREDFSNAMVDRYGKQLEEVVVSVHYLPGRDGMHCIDFTAEDFRKNILSYYGSMEQVAEQYYDHVEMAIAWAASLPMPKKLGHVQLIEKFRDVLPSIDPQLIHRRLERLVPLLGEAKMAVDVNMAGLRVKTCQQAYVSSWFLQQCVKAGIPCIYGSDAHKPEQVGFGWESYEEQMKLALAAP